VTQAIEQAIPAAGLRRDPRPVIMVGFVSVALPSVAAFQDDRTVIVIEEPDVVRKRRARATVEASPIARQLIEWEYQLEGAAERFLQRYPGIRPAAVAPLTEYATPFAARLSAAYGLPGAGVDAADRLRDKAALRRVTRAAGVANPESEAVNAPGQVREFMAAHPGPVVLKPANRQGSVGTRILSAVDEVEQAWAECVVQDEGVMVPDRPFPLRMLAERFISGHEYSVEMLLDRGLPVFCNVTDKLLMPGPRPIELGHVVPAPVDAALELALRRQTEAVLRAVGFQTGTVHCEWIVHGGVPYLVECAGRFAGDGIVDLIERAYPFPLVRSFWTLLKGESLPEPPPRRARQTAVVRFLVAGDGVVRSIEGLEAARGAEYVVDCSVDVEPGAVTRQPRSSWDRVGSVEVVAPTSGAAMRAAEEAIGRIRIEVVPAAAAVTA
jgi:biotin carboxylase